LALQGDPDVQSLFDSSVEEPKALVLGAVSRLQSGRQADRYTSAFLNGNPFAMKALSRRYGVPEHHLLATSAATNALALVCETFLNPGDHVVVETPGFDLLPMSALRFGAQIDYVQRRGGELDLGDVAAKVTSKTRLIILSDLHNPSGFGLSEATLRFVAQIAERHGALVVVDEVYGDYAAGARFKTAAQLGKNIVAVNSLTKIFGLSTLRFGWVVAAPEVLRPVRDLAERQDFTISNLAHAVAAVVLEDDETFDSYRHSVMAESRPIITAAFAQWCAEGLVEGLLPPYGCICFPRVIGVRNTVEFSTWLAQTHKVRVAPGEYFGAPGFVRIGFGKRRGPLQVALTRFGAGLRAYTAAGVR
jgi:aspartate/methionine/tyrosine aminotransferase